MTIAILSNTAIYIALSFCAIAIFAILVLANRAYKKRKREQRWTRSMSARLHR